MRFHSVQTAKSDPLDRHLESAHAATVALFREVLESADERLSILRRAGKTAHIERSLAAGACTDAALALSATLSAAPQLFYSKYFKGSVPEYAAITVLRWISTLMNG